MRATTCRVVRFSVVVAAAMSLATSGHVHAATANSQSITCAVSSVSYPQTLSGSGTNFTLVSAPTNGTLKAYSSVPSYGYWSWTNGGVVVYSACYVQYTPTAFYTGPDSFVWQAADASGTSGLATCSITVTTNIAPVAKPQSFSLLAGTVRYGISLGVTHADSYQTMTYTLTAAPTNGTLEYNSGGYHTVPVGTPITQSTWYYTSSGSSAGVDAIVWNVSDGISTSGNATCSITINGNNPPWVSNPTREVVCLQNSTNDMSSFLSYVHADTGQTMTYTLVSAPTNGTIKASGATLDTGSTVSTRQWSYIPTASYTGADNFAWSVSDGMAASTGTISIAVIARGAPPTPPPFKSGVKLMDGAKTLALGTRIVNGQYDFVGPVYRGDGPRNNDMAVAAPDLVDWNNDGLMDLVVGEADGRIALFINRGTKGHPVFNGYEYVKLSTGRDIRTYLGGCVCQGGGPECCAPRVVDWNHDGRKDLILGQWSGPTYGMNMFVYLNVGTDAAPVFDRKLACTLSSSSGYPTTMPCVTDWNGDGISDLISGDNPVGSSFNALINIFLGTSNDHGPSIVYNGNCWNYELYNWDEYNPSGSFQTTSPTMTTTNACPVSSRKSVVPADWTGSGKKDLITGRQDGTVYYSPNVGTKNFPAYTNYYRLQAGGSNIVIGSASKVGQDPGYGGQGNMYNQSGFPAVNEARLAIGDLDGDGLLDLVAGDVNGNVTVFYQSNSIPVAIDQSVMVLPNASKPITLSAKVDSGHAVTYSVLANPTNGVLSGSAPNLSYLPKSAYTGPDSFTFVAIDDAVTSRVATVSLVVGPHAPVARWTSPATLTATAVMNMNTSIDIVLTATDAGTEPLTYSIVTPPAHGTYSLSSNVVTYTPWAGYSGPDRFAYKANDTYQDSNPAPVNLDVCALAVNFQPPSAPVPAGYLADTGGVFNVAQGYGWDSSLAAATYNRGRTPDPRLDTFVYSTGEATWTCTLPNGDYLVSLTCGDSAAQQGPQQVVVNGVYAVSNITTAATTLSYLAGNVPVSVTNGQLTVVIGGGGGGTALNYVEIRCVYRPMGAATFVTEDESTQGNWKGVYGADGYRIITGLTSPRGSDQQVDYVVNSSFDYELLDAPSYAVVRGPPNGGWGWPQWKVWAFPTEDPRALEYPAPMLSDTRIAVAWYAANASSTISCDLNFTDGQTHRVAVYCLAWGNSSWAQTMDVLDAGDGTVLDSRAVSNFGGGKWLVWDLKGHVKIRATCTSGAVAISGFFFGTYAAPSITEHPMDEFAQTGQNATFSVSASGHPLFYQWQRSDDGWWWDDIPGANADSYTFATVSGDNGAAFRCVVTNSYGEDISYPAWLTVNETLPLPPVITSPLIVTCVHNQMFTYTVTALNNPTYFDAYMPPMDGSYDGIDMHTGVMTFNSPGYWNGYNTSWSDNTGTLYIPIIAGNESGEDLQILTLIINPPNAPVVTSPLVATGMVDVAFTYTITASPAATLYSAWDLQPWLALNTGTGVISGTPPPAATGTTNVTIAAGNANGTGLARLVITILGAPTITTQPSDVSVPVGQPATFSVTTTGTAPLSYQWMKGGTNVVGATNINYTIASAAYPDAGTYSVAVSNLYRSVTSSNATLTVTAGLVAPSITAQPANLIVAVAQPAMLKVVAAGTSPLVYQWMKGGTNLPGATGASYTIASAVLADSGSYSVTITNSLGSITSSSATLTVSNFLAAWWKLNETNGTSAADSSGNGHPGALQGGTATWTTNAGQIGGSLRLSGSGDMFLVNPALSVGTNSWTIAAWFVAPLPNTATWHTLVRANSGGDHLIVTDLSLNLGMYDTQTGGAFRGCGFNMGSLANGWHHIAAIGSGNTTQFYIDGIFVGTSDRKGGKDVYAVGNHQSGSQLFANGLDDVRVYTRTLTAAEILALASVPPTITVQPADQTVVAGQTATFSVTAGGSAPLFYQWLMDGETLDYETGSTFAIPFTFLSDSGDQFRVIVSNPYGCVTSTVATLTVTNRAPTVATPATATPSPVTGTTTVLTVGGADDGGELNLTYTWKTNGTPPGAVSYSRNGNHAAKATTVTFAEPGIYNFQVTIEDEDGLTATSPVAVTVIRTLTTIAVSPATATVATNATQLFSAMERDQFGVLMSGTCTWSVSSGGGTIDAAGLFTASASATGTWTYTVTATDGPVSNTAAVTVPGGGWRMCMGFPGYINRTEVLTNFPVLVVFSNNVNGSGFNYASSLSANGYDLRFTDASGLTNLNYEIESWNPKGASYVWVRVPALPPDGTGIILANWGDAANSNQLACTTNGSTWVNGYQLVAHLVGTNDSSANANCGAPASGVKFNTPGVVAGGVQLGSSRKNIIFGTAMRPTNDFSFGIWEKTSVGITLNTESTSSTAGLSGEQYVWAPDQMGNDRGAGLSAGVNGISVYQHGNGVISPLVTYTYPMSDSGWNYLVVVCSNRTPYVYRNGALVRTGLQNNTTYLYAPHTVGDSTTYGTFTGWADEARVANVARSADWVWAEYMTVASPDTFLRYGTAGISSSPQIMAVCGANGSMAPSGSVSVVSGSSQGFTITPDTWYEVNNVLVDGISVGANGTYSFTNVTAWHAIVATFTAQLAPLGTPLWWLAQYGWTNSFPAVELDDPDGDRLVTWKEYRAGTCPTSAVSCLQFRSIASVTGGLDLAFDNVQGVPYQVLWRTNLVSGAAWIPYTGMVGTGGIMHATFTNDLPQGFFQIRVAP